TIPPLAWDDFYRVFMGRFTDDTLKAIYHSTAGNLRHIQALITLATEATTRKDGAAVAITPTIIKSITTRFLFGSGVAA
ncbi:MAG: hypothetical protein AAB368_05395, partial [bacterium]